MPRRTAGCRKEASDEQEGARCELEEMSAGYESAMASVWSKLVVTFKEDIQEMKAKWEEAFRCVWDKGDAARRALEAELAVTVRATGEKEGELANYRARYHTTKEEEKKCSLSLYFIFVFSFSFQFPS